MKSSSGLFVVIDGPNGAGKSTLIEAVRQQLESAGIKVLVTREPGGTPFGEALRPLLKFQSLTDFARVLAMNAARVQHVAETIMPAVAEGKVVLCDRYLPSTEVFQHHLGRMSMAEADCMAQIHETMPAPHLMVFCLPSITTLIERRTSRAATTADEVDVLESSAKHEYAGYVKAIQSARERNWPVKIFTEASTKTIIMEAIEDLLPFGALNS